ncbi:SLBB domain-containing protein [Niveispirillum fermenti]|uniref:polysaccharide biosynthesis/export family protein n=1 Tax=Niveispirillum fermenti TaxID=1233113 RepID=UPI003A86845C
MTGTAEPWMTVAAEPRMTVAAEPRMTVAAEPRMTVAAEPQSGQPPQGRLERMFSQRAGQVLTLFGRDLFGGPPAPGLQTSGPQTNGTPLLGMVGDEYRLGPGDELSLLLRGQVSRSRLYRIGADGLLLIEDLRPIAAAGRSLRDVREEVEAAIAVAHLQTQAFLSVVAPRQVGVLVLGQVARPGRQQLPAFATALDALQAAGGVLPDGSLRAIRLLEPGGQETLVDLYDLMTRGDGAATRLLADGTRLVIPPIGPVVAAAGAVKRPGLYELPAGDGGLTGPDDTADLLALAGGSLRPGQDRSTLLRYDAQGVERPQPVSAGTPLPLRDGDLLLHAPLGGARQGSVTLGGAVAEPGERPLAAGMRLAGLVDADMLPADIYYPVAILLRRPAAGGPPEMLALDLAALLAGHQGEEARDGDRLLLLAATDVAFLRSRAVLSLLAGRFPDPGAVAACPGLASLAAALTADPGGPLAAGPGALAATGMEGPPLPCPSLFIDDPDLLPFLLRQSVFLRRGVMRPGPYPVAGPVALSLLAPVAGGRHEGRELAHPGQVADAGGDGILLAGAVRQPGLRPFDGGSLRSLLTGAGAPLPDAYGLAAILDRADPAGPARRTHLFAPADVLAGRFDLRLRDGDRVTLFHQTEVMAAPDNPDTPDPLEPAARALLRERTIAVRGGVMRPGEYPVAGPAPLDLLLRVAGGLHPDADGARVELTPHPPAGPDTDPFAGQPRLLPQGSAGAQSIPPGSALRVGLRQRPQERRSVLLAGEVMEPGTYDLAPGETLSGLLTRAGGLTADAYPDGTIFTRESARLAEEEGLRRNARELDRQLAQMLGGKNPPDPARVDLLRRLTEDLRGVSALGRITVKADPGVLADRPELDIPLMPGDRIHIPRRPLTVTVSGEVLSPASLLFDPEKTPRDYLREAGGLTRYADDGRIFIIHPDGAAEPLRSGWLSHRAMAITPGSMLVVPRDAEPFEWLPLAQSITTILSQIAFSAAAIAAIQD